MLDDNYIDKIISSALDEDIQNGDITSNAIFRDENNAEAIFLFKDDGVAAGFLIAEKVFLKVDSTLKFTPYFNDGDWISKGNTAASVKGKASSILTAERTALNFMQRMSGIATAVRLYQKKISHTKAKIIDTRKTVPGLRLIDKYSVRIGGAANHRIGLYDMFLIKDNHIAVAGSISKAVEACRKYNQEHQTDYKIEVETANLAQVKEALECSADRIMLDNYSNDEMKKAVELIGNKAEIEASGGITLETIKDAAETGVDYISVGAITHSVKALDISLEINLK